MLSDEKSSLLSDLKSPAPRIRLEAARGLKDDTSAEVLAAARARLLEEPDFYVRRALVQIVRTTFPVGIVAGSPRPADDESESDVVQDIWATATEEVATVLLHEFAPLVNETYVAAKIELAEALQGSRTLAAIERLQGLLGVLHQLRRAASSPAYEEFDLSDLVHHIVREVAEESDRVKLIRNDPMVVVGPKASVEVALSNGLRNAMEAVEVAGPEALVVISWGVYGGHSRIVVLDEGHGLPESFDQAFDFGRTTKSQQDHFGYGLPIARMAMRSAGGDVLLTGRERGGASFEMLWVDGTEYQ